MDLNERIARYLTKCAPAISGQDGHGQTFFVACRLVNGFALDEATALEYLKRYNSCCQPEWTERELIHKIKQAMKVSHPQPRGHLIGSNGSGFKPSDFPAIRPKPEQIHFDPATSIENYLKGFRITDTELSELSPIRMSDDWTKDAVLLISHLFHAGEKINYVTSFQPYVLKKGEKAGEEKAIPDGWGRTIERDELIELWSSNPMPQSDAGGWMRFNPVDGNGIEDKNVTRFSIALIEFDGIPLDLQASFLAKLPVPIAAILTSGGHSLHAWVKIDADDFKDYEETVCKMRDLLTRFGMDRKNKNPSRLSRLVGVTRKIGATGDGRQRLIYLNPNPVQKPIFTEEGITP